MCLSCVCVCVFAYVCVALVCVGIHDYALWNLSNDMDESKNVCVWEADLRGPHELYTTFALNLEVLKFCLLGTDRCCLTGWISCITE